MSASFCWIAPSCAIGPPNAWRSFAYDVASSNAACAIPTACAAMPIRPPSSVRSAIAIPLPGSPSRSAGVSSNTRSAVEDELSPSFSSSRATVNPSPPHDERPDPAIFLAREDEDRGRVGAVGDPLLGAGDATVGEARGHRGGIRAGAGLRQRERADLLAGRQRRHVGRAVLEQRQRARARVHRHRHADTRVTARQLLQDQHVGEEVRARPAVLLGDADAHEPQVAEGGEDVGGKRVVPVPLGGVRHDLLVREPPRQRADLLLLGGQLAHAATRRATSEPAPPSATAPTSAPT